MMVCGDISITYRNTHPVGPQKDARGVLFSGHAVECPRGPQQRGVASTPCRGQDHKVDDGGDHADACPASRNHKGGLGCRATAFEEVRVVGRDKHAHEEDAQNWWVLISFGQFLQSPILFFWAGVQIIKWWTFGVRKNAHHKIFQPSSKFVWPQWGCCDAELWSLLPLGRWIRFLCVTRCQRLCFGKRTRTCKMEHPRVKYILQHDYLRKSVYSVAEGSPETHKPSQRSGNAEILDERSWIAPVAKANHFTAGATSTDKDEGLIEICGQHTLVLNLDGILFDTHNPAREEEKERGGGFFQCGTYHEVQSNDKQNLQSGKRKL